MFRRATFLRETHPYATVLEEEEEDEEGLFKADAVNEEEDERNRATPGGGRGGRFIHRVFKRLLNKYQ